MSNVRMGPGMQTMLAAIAASSIQYPAPDSGRSDGRTAKPSGHKKLQKKRKKERQNRRS